MTKEDFVQYATTVEDIIQRTLSICDDLPPDKEFTLREMAILMMQLFANSICKKEDNSSVNFAIFSMMFSKTDRIPWEQFYDKWLKDKTYIVATHSIYSGSISMKKIQANNREELFEHLGYLYYKDYQTPVGETHEEAVTQMFDESEVLLEVLEI